MSSIFRKSALIKLQSPDQLDQRISIVSRGGILAFIAILLLIVVALVWGLFGTVTTTVYGNGILAGDETGLKAVAAPSGGIVTEVLKRFGDEVSSGDTVLNLVSDGKTVGVKSVVDGKISEMRVAKGQFVVPGMTVATVTSVGDASVVLAFVPASSGKRITPGMQVNVVPSTVNQEEYGSMSGKVKLVSERPVSKAEIQALLQDDQLTEFFLAGGPTIHVVVEVNKDSSTSSGFRWHTGSGPPFSVTDGTLAAIEVTIQEQAPITLILPNLESILGS